MNPKRGEYLYNIFGAVDTAYAKFGITYKFWAETMINIVYAGYKGIYNRATNPVSYKLLKKYGSITCKECTIMEGLSKG